MIKETLKKQTGGLEGNLPAVLAAKVRQELHVMLLDRAQEATGTDYRMGFEDGIRDTARWVLRDA